MIRRIRSFERLSRPRLPELFDKVWFLRLLGLVFVGLAVAAGFAPPFSGLDTLPALGAVVIALLIILGDVVVLGIGLGIAAGGIVLIVTVGAALFQRSAGSSRRRVASATSCFPLACVGEGEYPCTRRSSSRSHDPGAVAFGRERPSADPPNQPKGTLLLTVHVRVHRRRGGRCPRAVRLSGRRAVALVRPDRLHRRRSSWSTCCSCTARRTSSPSRRRRSSPPIWISIGVAFTGVDLLLGGRATRARRPPSTSPAS